MADYELLRTQGAGPTALYAMIGESIGEALTNVLVRSSRPRGSAAAAGGETPPRTPPPCAEGGPKGPETTPIILGRRLGALLRRWGGGQAPN